MNFCLETINHSHAITFSYSNTANTVILYSKYVDATVEISVIDFYVNFIPIKCDRVALLPDVSLHKMDHLMAAKIKFCSVG